ncbi:MAG: helix-turn-helix domain-containing protein [Lachnospiraceae bacterium]
MSFARYICLQRVKLARRLLCTTSMPLQEIAEHCGFQTTSYFSTCFKKEFGQSPSSIRRKTILPSHEYKK